MNSFTFNFDIMNWQRYWISLISITTCLLLLLFVFIILVDPYDTLSISLDKFREPIVSNQRYSYPAIAQKEKHDSVVIGTSSIRLLNPKDIDKVFGAKFVNLAMNSATAHEQYEIYKLFRKSHEDIKYFILGVDVVWCDTDESPDKLTFRPFPPWLYDENKLNDYFHMLSYGALENAVRMLEYWSGKREASYDINGYHNFVGDDNNYDLDKAIIKLYGSEEKRQEFLKKLPEYRSVELADIEKRYQFPVHDLYLKDMLSSLPENTKKYIFFVPYHYKLYYEQKDKFEACKIHMEGIANQISDTYIIDFMNESEITSNDENYWDPLHYRIGAVFKIINTIKMNFLISN